MKNAPIFIVDDDSDDRELLQEAWQQLSYQNPLVFFDSGEDVLNHLKSSEETPFLILCDVNIPKMNGFELKEKFLKNSSMNYKSIPFIFWSTSASKEQIQKAYDLAGHGFFIKENNFGMIKQSLIDIVEYWLRSVTPKDVQ